MSARDGASTAVRHLVFDWNLRLVRGLPEPVARDRMAQIESDLWEHAAAHHRGGRSDAALAAGMVGRLLRGLPADRAWRGEQQEKAEAARLRAPWPVGVARPKESEMKKRSGSPVAKPWVHLEEGTPFDQTNGVVDFEAEPTRDTENDEKLAMLERGAAMNIVNVGFGGGSF